VYPKCAIFSGIRSLFGINLVLWDNNCLQFMSHVCDMMNFHRLIPKCLHTNKVANLGDLPPNLAIF
jgi:hypothetical protein